MEDKKKEESKKRLVKFVHQTQQGCEKKVCMNDMCRNNPGRVS